MKEMNKILVAVDGSEHALNAVRYMSGMVCPAKTRIVLFNISMDVPEALTDLKNIPGYHHRMAEISAWRIQNKQKMEAFMEQAKQVILDQGFSSQNVKTVIRKHQVGIARDILEESKDGYQAIVVGRRGASRIKDLIIGSTANKLVAKSMRIPVIVVGGSPEPGKVLMAFDGSKNALKAVNRLSILADPDKCKIEICHVIRSITTIGATGDINVFPVDVETTWMKESIKNIEPMISDIKKRLIKAGFSPDRLSVNILTNKPSRAFAILDEAESGGYGTIVVGRRGLTLVQEFTMGRVGRKIVHAADHHAVWVVG